MREGLGNAIDHLTYLIETLPQVRLVDRLREIRDVLYAQQPAVPAPITAGDVLNAENAWDEANWATRGWWSRADFIAEHLNTARADHARDRADERDGT